MVSPLAAYFNACPVIRRGDEVEMSRRRRRTVTAERRVFQDHVFAAVATDNPTFECVEFERSVPLPVRAASGRDRYFAWVQWCLLAVRGPLFGKRILWTLSC
jgi:hypothetical protein